MHQNQDDFAEYRGYTQNTQEIDYSHPDYYQQQEQIVPDVPKTREAQPKQERPPAHNPYAEYSGYSEYGPTIQADPYTQEHRESAIQTDPYTQEHREPATEADPYTQEYRGPQHMEGYIENVGNYQQEASQRGHAEDGPKKKRGLAGIGGLIVTIGAFLLKFQSLVFLLKFGMASFSIIVSIAVYALFYGWTFAIGIVALLFVHEMGHAVVMKLKGIPLGGMIFIPMLGAAVTMKQMPQNARDEAEVGIAGPIAGTIAASVCLLIAQSHPEGSIWAPLAYFGFFINLFNLIPIVPFDGGRVLAAIDKRIWFLGFFLLIAFQIWQWFTGNFSLWLLIFTLFAASQLWSRGMGPSTPESKAYYAVPLVSRIALTVLYFGLLIVLVLGMTMAHNLIPVGI
ncbi:MAG TPA: site-2 protease family protein [Ktedonobacteraceae bacterium]|jgi:Zn-dependent protease|nr:site-2 protease family protein [Ktedonobacteraceae bacterium]